MVGGGGHREQGVEPSFIARWTTRPGWQPIGGSQEEVWIEEADDLFLYRPAHCGIKPGGDLLGGVSALQKTDLTGPLSIFKLLP